MAFVQFYPFWVNTRSAITACQHTTHYTLIQFFFLPSNSTIIHHRIIRIKSQWNQYSHTFSQHMLVAVVAAVLRQLLLLMLLNLNVNEDDGDDECPRNLIRSILFTREENCIPFANAPYTVHLFVAYHDFRMLNYPKAAKIVELTTFSCVKPNVTYIHTIQWRWRRWRFLNTTKVNRGSFVKGTLFELMATSCEQNVCVSERASECIIMWACVCVNVLLVLSCMMKPVWKVIMLSI